MPCDHTLQEIGLREPEYEFIYPRTGVINIMKPKWTVPCVCIHCGKGFLVTESGDILKELVDGL